MLETSLIQYLLSDSTIEDLVSTRIYPLQLPQETDESENQYPAITIQLISEMEDFSQDGPADKSTAIIQVNSIGELYLDAKELASAVRDSLNGIRGDMEGVAVQGIFRSGETDNIDRDMGIYTVMTDYEIHYTR